MTLTIELPDETAALIQAAAERDGVDIATFTIRAAVASADADAPASTPQPRRRSLMEFSGIGKDQPGSVVGSVQEYVRAMRDEWDERDQELDRRRQATRTVTVYEALRGVVLLGIDTNIIISFIEQEAAYHPRCEVFFRAIDAGLPGAVTSTITLTETLVGPMKTGNQVLKKAYEDFLAPSDNLAVLPVTATIATRAAELRALHRMPTPDALQIATALEAGCDTFLTNDRLLRRVTELRVLVLDDLTL